MIVMDLRADNLLCFNSFHMNFSYPKKIVNSFIENEYLTGRTNFRYKRINVIMGSNATGKTSLGRLIMSVFNFIHFKNLQAITDHIANAEKPASFRMDFVICKDTEYTLYRIITVVTPPSAEGYQSKDVSVSVISTPIRKNDNYEMCSARLDFMEKKASHQARGNYVEELEKIIGLSWFFVFPVDDDEMQKYAVRNDAEYLRILEYTLKVLDPSIQRVDRIENAKDSFVIRLLRDDVIVQEGQIAKPQLLSTGTKAGIKIAEMLASICMRENDFYYCDEKFSFINSDIEKAILILMIEKLGDNRQLFFTTHNTDILDLPLPKHTYYFLRKELDDDEQSIVAVNAGEYLKKSTDSLRNAAENDLFVSAPSLELLDEIAKM